MSRREPQWRVVLRWPGGRYIYARRSESRSEALKWWVGHPNTLPPCSPFENVVDAVREDRLFEQGW